ncbi:MAG: hypothetical protein AB7R89_12555 [Dehalococcoidia bacterium]
MTLRLQWPVQRRQSTWERLRSSVLTREELLRLMQEARRLGQELPDPAHLRDVIRDPAELAHRAQPWVDRMAAVRHDGLARLGNSLGKPKPSTKERILDAGIPVWLALGIGIGALMIGFGLGKGAAASRMPAVRQEDIEAAADQIKERWPSVHDDDIREANGNLKQLSSVIGERTGESVKRVRERLTTMTTGQSANGQS